MRNSISFDLNINISNLGDSEDAEDDEDFQHLKIQ